MAVSPATASATMASMTASPKLAVHCRQVVKEFGDGDDKVMALQGIDLEVPDGEMTLLVGPSGCGKTTLICIIAGLLEPTRGEVTVLGEELHRMKDRHKVCFRGKNIGFVFQQYCLLPALSAVENAAVPLLVAGWSRAKAFAKARAMIEAVGLGPRADALPAHLSGGQQQRVAIARALVHEPKLLVCDEPTAALDAHSGQMVMELLCQVAVQPGRAVIVVSHDNRVYRFGNRMVTMSDGCIETVTTQPGYQPDAIPA